MNKVPEPPSSRPFAEHLAMNTPLNQTIKSVKDGFLSAPDSFLAADYADLFAATSGCGTARAKYDFVPDNLWGLYIGQACYIHDWRYREGKTNLDREIADREFRDNMLKIVERESHGFLKPLRRRRAFTLYKRVVKRGEPAFLANKNLESKWKRGKDLQRIPKGDEHE